MKPNKILSSLTALALLGGAFSAFCGSQAVKVSADDSAIEQIDGASKYGYKEDADFATSDDFKVVVQEATSTETSQSYTIKLMSGIYTNFTSTAPWSGVYIAPLDSSCPVNTESSNLVRYDFDPANPDLSMVECDEDGNPKLKEDGSYNFVPDADGVTHGYISQIPVYEGYVYQLKPSDQQKNIVIPNYINRSSYYKIHVTSIASNVFNYRVQSNGTVKNYLNKVTNIYIGDNVTSISDNAFEGITSDKSVNINITSSESSFELLGESWAGNGNVTYNYNIDNITSFDNNETTIKTIKSAFDNSPKTDKDGNVIYHDEYGNRLDAEGYYLDENGNRTDKQYDGAPITDPNAKVTAFIQKKEFASNSFTFGDLANNKPMVLEYEYEYEGQTYKGFYEFTSTEQTGMGKVAGITEVVKYVDIHKPRGAKINNDSLVIHNIYEDGADPELQANPDKEYQILPDKTFKHEFSFDQFVDVKKQAVRKYGNYTAFTMTVDKVKDIYPIVNPSSWNSYKEKVASGNIKIRYSFVGFNASTYEITYVKDGVEVTKQVSFNDSAEKGLTLNFHLLTKDKDNAVTFLLKNHLIDEDGSFNANTVKKVEYKGVSIKLDLMNTKKGTTQVVTKSDVVTRFGYIDILTDANDVKVLNADLILIIASIAFVAAYVLAATGYYFFAKNKYKNDEFRRMNTKKYLKQSGLGFVGGALLYLALLFIVVRFAFFNVSVIVYNPLDPMVVILGVIGIIVLGVFGKKAYAYAKVANERRKAKKLKLNDDVLDDGTK